MLNERLVLMLTNVNGMRYINVNLIFKQLAIYFLLIIVGTIGFFIITIFVFTDEIASLKKANVIIQKEYSKMIGENDALKVKVSQRIEELTLIGNRFEDLEDIIGGKIEDGVASGTKNTDSDGTNELAGGQLGAENNANLAVRIDTASITGLQKAFVMRFIPNGLPLDFYNRVSNGFGYRVHPILHIRHLHTGIDLSVKVGSPVFATADGVVDFARATYNGGYGHLVKITHSFGFKTFYAHLSRVVINRGEFVKKGQIIAYSGNTGMSTGPHLHYEVRFLGVPINPRGFIDWTLKDFNSIFTSERNISWQSLLTTINQLMEPTQAVPQS